MSAPASTAAFFDLDGTLLPAPSLEFRFLQHLFARRLLPASNAFKWLMRSAYLLPLGIDEACRANKTYLAGLPESLASNWIHSIGAEDSPNRLRFFEQGWSRLAWHQSQNHRVFLISGTLALLAVGAACFLPRGIQVVATKLSTILPFAAPQDSKIASAIWTGELSGEHMVGRAKMRAICGLAVQHGIDLQASYAYGDSLADCPMLEAVGHPQAVNPSRGLTEIARKRGWPVSSWKHTDTDREKGRGGLVLGACLARPESAEDRP
ncbi:MAG TPA: haloacid dehalogenase-like hydrolase [Candidatus Acidoferrales bacterium]